MSLKPECGIDCLSAWFSSFCRSHASDDVEVQRNLDLKELHTLKVLEAVRLIAAGAGERRRFLAEVAALCHDLGRFPQFQRYRTFRDSESVNHAHLSAQILFESGLLERFSPAEATGVLTAVRLHNAFQVPSKLDELGEDLLRMVRDADKLDIWRVFIEYFAAPEKERVSGVGLGLPDTAGCSPQVIKALADGEMVQLQMLKTLDDFKLLQLSWLYDINFVNTLRLVRERRIVESFRAILPDEPALVPALDRVQAYLERRLHGG